MCSVGIKKIFLSSYFVGVFFFIKDSMFYEIVCSRDSLAELSEKVRFIRC